MKGNKQDLRYLGFECDNDGGRAFDFAVTTFGLGMKVVSVEVPAFFFVGAGRISFQEDPGICYEKLRRLLTSKQERTEIKFGVLLTMCRAQMPAQGPHQSQTLEESSR